MGQWWFLYPRAPIEYLQDDSTVWEQQPLQEIGRAN